MRKLVAVLTAIGALGLASPALAYQTWLTDPTGRSSPDRPLSGLNYGNPTPAERAQPTYPPKLRGGAQPSLGHVPTDQQIARGAKPAIVELAPVPRPPQREPLLQQVRPTRAHW